MSAYFLEMFNTTYDEYKKDRFLKFNDAANTLQRQGGESAAQVTSRNRTSQETRRTNS